MATNAANVDGNQAALQTALDDAIAAGMAPKCAAAVRAHKLIRQLQKHSTDAAPEQEKTAEEKVKEEAAVAEVDRVIICPYLFTCNQRMQQSMVTSLHYYTVPTANTLIFGWFVRLFVCLFSC